MEQDRFSQNKGLFIFGMVSLAACWGLVAFALYILPMLIWQWNYDVPEFLFTWRESLRESYAISEAAAGGFIVSLLLFLAIVTGYIAHYISNYIDKQIVGIVEEETPENTENISKEVKETFSFGGQLFILLVLVIVAVLFIHWLVAIPEPQ
ncbi:hypothetical protein [Legionella spiritensis]|uniref:Transmembrane protein n=1 Tax=Legionella spiritensis TaxID=452 RepID=A0A0W0YYA2_LEGSP|nr:hypothetical protein [Legionella spiritensis]KTD61803.1 transmembrane protein [Legionella spiritensis]SNV38135.1 transmembrane protein [Legionella spiritensis]